MSEASRSLCSNALTITIHFDFNLLESNINCDHLFATCCGVAVASKLMVPLSEGSGAGPRCCITDSIDVGFVNTLLRRLCYAQAFLCVHGGRWQSNDHDDLYDISTWISNGLFPQIVLYSHFSIQSSFPQNTFSERRPRQKLVTVACTCLFPIRLSKNEH